MKRRLNKFSMLSRSERRLFVEAATWLGVARLALLVLPFRRIARHLGCHMAETPEVAETDQAQHVEWISWAIRTASRHMPWDCKCLTQAIAGKGMLWRRGVSSTLYLGLAKDDQQQLRAHAWLRSGDMIVTGARAKQGFSVVSTFAEDRRL